MCLPLVPLTPTRGALPPPHPRPASDLNPTTTSNPHCWLARHHTPACSDLPCLSPLTLDTNCRLHQCFYTNSFVTSCSHLIENPRDSQVALGKERKGRVLISSTPKKTKIKKDEDFLQRLVVGFLFFSSKVVTQYSI